MRRSVTFLAVGLLIASPVFAQTEDDRAAAQAAISQLIADTADVDIEGISSVTPPALTAIFAAMSGQSAADLEVSMQNQIRDLMEQVNVESYEMDLDAALGGITSTGRPYFVVPSRMTMEVIGAGRVLTTFDTLAFEDDGQWWLIRVEDPGMNLILRQAFPDLSGIEYAAATMEGLQ